MKNTLSCLPFLLLVAAPGGAAPSASQINQQIATVRAVKEVALAEDGQSVAAVITDPTIGGGHAHLWRLSPHSPPLQLTGMKKDGAREDSAPQWTADGKTIVYLSKQAGFTTISRVARDGGIPETLHLAKAANDVRASWSAAPPGKRLTALGFALAPSGGKLAVWAQEEKPGAGTAGAGDDSYRADDRRPIGLLLMDGAGGVSELPLPDDVHGASWSSDGRSLLVVTMPATDDLGEPNRLWLIGADGIVSQLSTALPTIQTAAWGPDSRSVIYLAQCARSTPTNCRDVYAQAFDAPLPRNLTAAIAGSVMTAPILMPRHEELLLTIAQGFEQKVARIHLADGRLSWVEGLPPVTKAIATNVRRSGVALLAADRGRAPAAGIAQQDATNFKPIDGPLLAPALWAPLIGTPLAWRSEGKDIEGRLYLPAREESERAPLVVNVHGGPAGRFDETDYPIVRMLLAKGWAVLHVNPRGSLGYGTGFLAANRDDLGGGDYRDIMAGIDTALRSARLDERRLAMIGFSYGGTMTGFALGRTTRFRALVSAAPVTNQISEYGTEDSSWYDRWYFGQPWRRLEAAWRQSPLAGVAAARTPFLLLQGEADTVDPPGQSYEMYRALRQERSPVELMLFPRETHRELGQNFYGYPSVEATHGIVMRARIVDFIEAAFSNVPNAGLEVRP